MSQMWTELDEAEYDRVWGAVYERFDFQPSGGTSAPVIRDPQPSITFDIRATWDRDTAVVGAATRASIEASARRCFLAALGVEVELFVLDWQHPGYRFRPGAEPPRTDPWEGLTWGHPTVVPDGDYYIYTSLDLAEGTFGHPWEPSLCVFGERMTGTLGVELATWLPVLRREDG